MQVVQAEIKTEQFVAGGADTEAYGIEDGTGFYSVMSDNIYRDKPRAAIRETICNGWDSHVVSGITDIPLKVTLSDAFVSIRDYGDGIPHKLLRDVYCVYFRSTKAESEGETGCFGLGTKAPYAISRHFTVNNFHAGKKITNLMTRASEDTGGKPGMKQMSSVDTTETGIEVIIPITKEMRYEISKNIKAVAFQGGMKIKLNGDLLPSIDYTEARKSGFMITSQIADLNESDLYVLYGTVLYPVVSVNERLNKSKNSLTNPMSHTEYKTIVLAKPSSIGVAPSRESLSYSEGTIDTLVEAFDKISRNINARMGEGRKACIDQLVSLYSRYQGNNLMDRVGVTPILTWGTFGDATNYSDAAALYFNSKGFSSEEDEQVIVAKILNSSYQTGSFLRNFSQKNRPVKGLDDWDNPKPRTWRDSFVIEATRHASRLVIRAVGRAGELQRLAIIKNGVGYKAKSFQASQSPRIECLNVVIAQSRTLAVQTINKDKRMRKSAFVHAVIIPDRQKAERAALIKELRRSGLTCHEVFVAPKIKKEVKPATSYNFTNLSRHYKGNGYSSYSAYNEPPAFYMSVTSTKDFSKVERMKLKKAGDAVSDRIAVVIGKVAINKAKDAGAVDIIQYCLNEIRKTANKKDTKFAFLMAHFLISEVDFGNIWHIKKIMNDIPSIFFEIAIKMPPSKADSLKIFNMIQLCLAYWNVEYTRDNQDEGKLRVMRLEAREELSEYLPSKIQLNNEFYAVRMLDSYECLKNHEMTIKIIRAIKRESKKKMAKLSKKDEK